MVGFLLLLLLLLISGQNATWYSAGVYQPLDRRIGQRRTATSEFHYKLAEKQNARFERNILRKWISFSSVLIIHPFTVLQIVSACSLLLPSCCCCLRYLISHCLLIMSEKNIGSRTVWPKITTFYTNFHTGRVYNHTGYDVTICFWLEVIGVRKTAENDALAKFKKRSKMPSQTTLLSYISWIIWARATKFYRHIHSIPTCTTATPDMTSPATSDRH